jgi:hypothetical protein
VHAAVSYGRPRYGVEASYAFVDPGSDVIGNSSHLGLAVRYSPFGDIWLRSSLSIYDSLSVVLRGELTWRIPLGSVVSLRPGVAAYFTDVGAAAGYPCTDPFINAQNQAAQCTSLGQNGQGLQPGSPGNVMGSLTLFAGGRYGALWLGGKFGDEFRTAYMDGSLIYDGIYHVGAGAWVGGQVPLDQHWLLGAQAAWDRYFIWGTVTQPNGEIDQVPTVSDGFYLTLGVARRF